MRTFFAIPLQEGVRESIRSAAGQLRAATQMRASWVRPENYHLTVRFLGDIEPMLTVDLTNLADELVADRKPFEIPLERIGAFPSFDRARVLWIGGDAPDTFVDLVGNLNAQITRLGFKPERKATIAHVTIARVKGRFDEQLGSIVRDLGPLRSESVHVDRIVLMQSELAPGGAIYTPLAEAHFGRRERQEGG